MSTTRLVSALTTVALATAAVVGAAPAQAAPQGSTSLAEVLAADGNSFDRNWDDFDITEKAVLAVLENNPDSPVGLLADGETALTAFVPTDRAFRKLVKSVTGERPATEKATFATVASLGLDTVEDVLLYHVVPGATIRYGQAKRADGAALESALGTHVTVVVKKGIVRLVDQDGPARNPRIIKAAKNLNKGNKQIAHGIDRVLRPILL
ncbi:MAG: fasciclin domain-containing protein [Nocardioides sp.]